MTNVDSRGLQMWTVVRLTKVRHPGEGLAREIPRLIACWLGAGMVTVTSSPSRRPDEDLSGGVMALPARLRTMAMAIAGRDNCHRRLSTFVPGRLVAPRRTWGLMTALVLPGAAAPSTAPVAGRAEETGTAGRRPAADTLLRFAASGALTLSVAIPLLVLLLYVSVPPDSRHWWAAVVATAVYLPLHVRHVAYGLRGVRPRFLPWTLVAMAVVITGFTPVLGADWLYSFQALAASLLVTIRPRLSFLALCGILAGVWIWAAELGANVAGAIYYPVAVLDRSMMVFVLVWLVGALRRAQKARLALAAEALAAERARVDDELSVTVGEELEAVVRSGERGLRTMAAGSAGAETELRSLVEGSRGALADARRLISRYREVSARTELERAVALLRAAGIEARSDVRDEQLPPAFDEPLRASLRAAVARLLREEVQGPVVLGLGHHDGACTLHVLRIADTEQAG